jgi:hypothetical protein
MKRLDEVEAAEEFLTLKKSNANIQKEIWTKFYTWGHVERDTLAEFIKFKVGQDGNGLNKELKISSEHLIFVADNKDGRNKVAKKAGQLCVGMKLQL